MSEDSINWRAKMKKLFIIVLLITLPVLLFAQEGKIGTAGAQFLKIGLSARATGMAGAFTAVTNDAEAIFWNPGALAQVQGNDITAAYVQWPADIVYSGAALATNIEGVGVLGFHIAGLKAGDMRVRTLSYPEGNGQMFTASQFVGGISYSTFLTDRFAIGATWKYVQEDFHEYSSANWAVDVGTYYHTGFRSLVIGMSILNFGPESQFDGSYLDYSDPAEGGIGYEEKDFAPYNLPLTFKFGLAMNVYETEDIKVLTALDTNKPNDNEQRVNAGVEFSFIDMLALRGGYNVNYDEQTFTFGAGFKYNLFGTTNVRLDYSYGDLGVLDVVHRGSFGLSF